MTQAILTVIGFAASVFVMAKFPADPFTAAEGGGIPMGIGVAWGVGLTTLFFLGLAMFLGRELIPFYSKWDSVKDAVMEFSLMLPILVAIVVSIAL